MALDHEPPELLGGNIVMATNGTEKSGKHGSVFVLQDSTGSLDRF